MNMKSAAIAVAMCVSLSAAAFAQTISPSASTPVVDAAIGASEYSYTVSHSGMRFGAALSADGKTLYCVLEAPTSGWVAIGLGSLRMDGAYMVMAYDAAGATTVSEETGKGHSHRTNPTKKLIASSVRELDGKTTLEFAVPAADFITGTSLKTLMAYGKKDNLTSLHAAHHALETPVDR